MRNCCCSRACRSWLPRARAGRFATRVIAGQRRIVPDPVCQRDDRLGLYRENVRLGLQALRTKAWEIPPIPSLQGPIQRRERSATRFWSTAATPSTCITCAAKADRAAANRGFSKASPTWAGRGRRHLRAAIRTSNDMPIDPDPSGLDALSVIDFQLNAHYTNAVPGLDGRRATSGWRSLCINPPCRCLACPRRLAPRSRKRITLHGPFPGKWFRARQEPTRWSAGQSLPERKLLIAGAVQIV